MHTCPNCRTPLTPEGRTSEGQVMSCPNQTCPLNRITDTYENLRRMDVGTARRIQINLQSKNISAGASWHNDDEAAKKTAARNARYGNRKFGDPE